MPVGAHDAVREAGLIHLPSGVVSRLIRFFPISLQMYWLYIVTERLPSLFSFIVTFTAFSGSRSSISSGHSMKQ